jgi:hypothetical protein
VTGAVLLALAAVPVSAERPKPAPPAELSAVEAGDGAPSTHYLDWLAHADEGVSFTPGGAATVPFRPRADDRRLVAGRAPVALPAGGLGRAERRDAASTVGAAGDTNTAAQVDPNGMRREVLGFLPYWELSDADLRLDYSVLSTIAYFGVGADGQEPLAVPDEDGSAPCGLGGQADRLRVANG